MYEPLKKWLAGKSVVSLWNSSVFVPKSYMYLYVICTS